MRIAECEVRLSNVFVGRRNVKKWRCHRFCSLSRLTDVAKLDSGALSSFATMADCWKFVYKLVLIISLLVAALFVQLTFTAGKVLTLLTDSTSSLTGVK